MAREFKLGPAMLRAEDSPHVPDIWLDSLLHKHLGRAGRSLFAQTSKAALNLLLSEWPQAILNVRVQAFAIEPPERLLRRMHAAQQQIAARGSKDTWLGIKQHGDIPAGKIRTVAPRSSTAQEYAGSTHTQPYTHTVL